jgi:hypothetical protein
VKCQSVHSDDFVSLFSMCRNLKKVEIHPGMWSESTMAIVSGRGTAGMSMSRLERAPFHPIRI